MKRAGKQDPLDVKPPHWRVIQPLEVRCLPPLPVQRDNSSIVFRQLMITMARITRLNCRVVVVEITGAMLCKSATISVMGFS
jgi:hypothetical protein